ncbi:hypothetical protein MOF8_06185 [Methylobacterium oryzae]|uniref:SHOCT domain-containing protein n=1 Tax=Methylobacterium oryzae TaxID=334852 RepID=UPI002F33C5C4
MDPSDTAASDPFRDDGPFDPVPGLQAVAERHGVSLDAVRHLIRALERGHGTMAQFDHPDLGGMGQWFSGGMVMVGRMFDDALKARVDALCTELAGALPAGGFSEAAPTSVNGPPTLGTPTGALSGRNANTAAPVRPMRPRQKARSGTRARRMGRVPTSGEAGTAHNGAQDGLRYAYFPDRRRLAVDAGSGVALYDTGEHRITGVSQANGSLGFTGPAGAVALDRLRRIEAEVAAPRQVDPSQVDPSQVDPSQVDPSQVDPSQVDPSRADTAQRPAPAPDRSPADAVLTTIERLADLHARGVLTDAEFATKKAELLARL